MRQSYQLEEIVDKEGRNYAAFQIRHDIQHTDVAAALTALRTLKNREHHLYFFKTKITNLEIYIITITRPAEPIFRAACP